MASRFLKNLRFLGGRRERVLIAYIGSSSSSHSDFGYDVCNYYPGYDDCNSHSNYDNCMVSVSKEGDTSHATTTAHLPTA